MQFFKNVWAKLKNPKPIWLTLFYIAFVLVITGTLLLVIMIKEQTVFHYILYVFSATFLTYFVYTMVILAPKMKNGIINLLKKYRFTRIMLSNFGYRTIVFSIFSFVFNIAYMVFLGILGIMSRSAWYISLTAYYLCLSLMKGSVLYSKKKYNTQKKQAKVYGYCGRMFIFLTLALSGIIVLIYTSNMYFEYAGLLIYAVATYTFWNLSLAIFNIFKARKTQDLYIQSLRNVNFVKSLVSIIVLQVALFQAFSPENNTSFANGLTGAVVSLIILLLGVYMIVKSKRYLKTEKTTQTNIENEVNKETLDNNLKVKDIEDVVEEIKKEDLNKPKEEADIKKEEDNEK